MENTKNEKIIITDKCAKITKHKIIGSNKNVKITKYMTVIQITIKINIWSKTMNLQNHLIDNYERVIKYLIIKEIKYTKLEKYKKSESKS